MFISIVNVPKLNVSFLQHGMYFNWMKLCLLCYKYLMDASNWINLSIFSQDCDCCYAGEGLQSNWNKCHNRIIFENYDISNPISRNIRCRHIFYFYLWFYKNIIQISISNLLQFNGSVFPFHRTVDVSLSLTSNRFTNFTYQLSFVISSMFKWFDQPNLKWKRNTFITFVFGHDKIYKFIFIVIYYFQFSYRNMFCAQDYSK